MDRVRTPLHTDSQICCLNQCWPASQQPQPVQAVRSPEGSRQQILKRPIQAPRTKNPWKEARVTAIISGKQLNITANPAQSEEATPQRKKSQNARANEAQLFETPPRRNNSSTTRIVNSNQVKQSKKPTLVLCSKTPQPWSAPKRLALDGTGTIELERTRQNLRTQPFWSLTSSSKNNLLPTEYSSGHLTAEKPYHQSRILKTMNVNEELFSKQLRFDSNNHTAASSYVMQSPMQVANKRSRGDLHTTPQTRYGERSDSEDQQFLLIPQKERIRAEKLWTLSAKQAESESGSDAIWEARREQLQQHPEQRKPVLCDLFIREVSESRADNNQQANDKEIEDIAATIKRTHTLPNNSLLVEHKPRASHQVLETYRVDSIDEMPEYSRMSVEHPVRRGDYHLKDAKTVNSQGDSSRSKSIDARDHSEVVFRKSVGSDISSLHLYTARLSQPTSERADRPNFLKKAQKNETLNTQPIKGLNIGPLVGLGRFRSWRKAKDTKTGFLVTLSEFQLSTIRNHDLRMRLQMEMRWNQRLLHQNIIEFYAVVSSESKEYFIFETGEESLGSYLRQLQEKGSYLCEREAIRFIKDILTGLQYLHNCHIVHGHLTPDKIMLVAGTCKIFDLSYAENSEEIGEPSKSEGTQRKSKQKDCWNVGLIAYYLLYPTNVPVEFDELARLYAQKQCLPELLCTTDYESLIDGLLNPYPQHRLTARKALQHPLLIL